MKKILIFILFAFSISFVNAQKSEEPTTLEKLNLRPIESVLDEHGGKRDKETNVLRINRKEYFKSETLGDANAIALFYLQEKRDMYGLSSYSNDIKIVKTMKSPAGQYVYCQQYVNDISVFATNFIIYINKENTITYTLNEFRNVAKYTDVKNKPSVNIGAALKIANEYLNVTGDVIGEPKTELVYFESMDKGLELAWKININSMQPMGDWQVFVSASDGHIIHVEDISMSANGSGKVFIPNPIVSANSFYAHCCGISINNCLLHDDGATNACLENQLFQVTLNDITYENGLYKLKGPYCVVQDIEPPYGHNIPELSTPNFYYTRNQGEFGAVMCYYYVDLSARRISQLGYDISYNAPGLKNLRIDPHGYNEMRGAWYNGGFNYIGMGSKYGNGNSFIPACEEADIILHEYGHAIQSNLGIIISTTLETKSVLEGCSDYWATSYKRNLYPNNWAELGLWFGMGFAARRADLNWVYPTDYKPSESAHTNGQIWSSALMKIWGDLGRDITDKLFLETHLNLGIMSSYVFENMRDAASAFMQADVNLYGGSHLSQISARFQQHGLISCPVDITYSNTNNLPASTKVSNNIQTSGTVTVKSTDNVTFDAGNKVILNPGFKVEAGGTFKIETNGCGN